MDLPYPYFMELTEYCADPEGFGSVELSEEEEEEKKRNVLRGLEQLRSDQ
jgi:hypothetical protein